MSGGSPGFPPGEENPWKTGRVDQIYANPWFSVEEHQVTRPDGRPGIYGVVRPTHLALGIVPLDADDHVWLVGQYRYPLDRYSWEIPEGGGNPRLDLREEAARELAEETGLSARRWDRLLDLHTSNCFTSEQAVIFLARDLVRGTPDPDDSERLQLIRVSLEQALEGIRRGIVTDAMSVAALLELERRKQGGELD